jgi:hypothetical protein
MDSVTAQAELAGSEAGEAPPADLARPVVLYDLTFLEEGDEVTVGRQDVDSYCVLPADGAALLRQLQRGVPPQAAADWYAQAYGQPVDIAEFLAAMTEMEFIAGPGETPTVTAPVRWQRLGRVAFSPLAWAAYGALIVAAAVAMARVPALIPQYRNLFFTQYITVISLLLYFGQFPLIVLHEAFHELAGRRLGLRTRLGFGRRLYFVVVETTMDGLVSVPRRKRYLPILAGMLADVLVIAIFTLVAALLRRPDGTEPLAGGILLALAFATLLRFVWQFYFYLRTDIYQAVVTVMGCVDLQKAARVMIGNRVNGVLRRHQRVTDEARLHPTDRAVARWYTWLLVGGYAFSIGTLVLAGVPTMIRVTRIIGGRLVSGTGSAGLTDSVVFLLVNVVQFAFIGYLVTRDRRRRRRVVAASHVID